MHLINWSAIILDWSNLLSVPFIQWNPLPDLHQCCIISLKTTQIEHPDSISGWFSRLCVIGCLGVRLKSCTILREKTWTYLNPATDTLTVKVIFINFGHFVFIADLSSQRVFYHAIETFLQTANFLRLQQNLPLKILTGRINETPESSFASSLVFKQCTCEIMVRR